MLGSRGAHLLFGCPAADRTQRILRGIGHRIPYLCVLTPLVFVESGPGKQNQVPLQISPRKGGSSQKRAQPTAAHMLSLLIQDGSTANGANGQTFAYGGQCSGCLGYINNCNGQCTSAAWVWGVIINLNGAEISDTASGNGTSAA